MNDVYAVFLKPGADFCTHAMKSSIRKILDRENIYYRDVSRTWWHLIIKSGTQYSKVLQNDNKVLKEIYFGGKSDNGRTGAILYVLTNDEKQLRIVRNEMVMELGMHIEYHKVQVADYTPGTEIYNNMIKYIVKKTNNRQDVDYKRLKRIIPKLDSTKIYSDDEMMVMAEDATYSSWDDDGVERMFLKLKAVNEFNQFSVK